MKILSTLVLTFCLFLSANLFSQSISNYAFGSDTVSSLSRTHGSLVDDVDMTTGLTILLGGSNVNTYSTATNIGFDFWVNGTRQTQFNVSSNGWVGLPTAYPFYNWLQYTGVRLAPFLSVGATNMATAVNGVIHSKTIGSAPSRVCVIEFLNMVMNSSVSSDTSTFQVRLYEQTGEIEYVYGPMRIAAGATSTTPINFNVGFQFTTTVYQSVNINSRTSSTSTNSTASFTSNGLISQLNSFVNGSRRCFRWIPNPPNDPTNLIFTAITGSGMTLNWTASSNATSYALYKSLDSGVTYTYLSTLPSTTTWSVQSGLPASTDVFWRLYAIRESVSNSLDGDAVTLTPAKVYSITSGNWNTASIWSSGTVPSSSDSVMINSGNTVVINTNTAACYSLEVAGTLNYGSTLGALVVNADVTVYSGGVFDAGTSSLTTHTLAIGGNASSTTAGNLTNNGTFDMNTSANVTVTFFGNQNATISGTSSTFDFASIIVNKGLSSATMLDVTGVITMAAPTTGQRLTLTNGTFRLSSASTITPYYGGSFNSACTGTARLWVNNAGAVINTTATAGGYVYFLTGSELRIDNGTVTIGSGTYSFYCYGLLRMNGGTLTCYGGIYTISGTGGINMTGGNLNLDPQGAGNLPVGTATLNLTSGTTFIWSGGIITIVNPHSAAGGSAVLISGGTITGGTLQIGDGVSVKTGGVFSNTSGFGINCTVDLFNVVINNNISASNTRMVRLLANLRVNNSLEIKSGGYLFNGSATTGYTMQCFGNFKNNGTIAGTEPGGVQQIGTISLEGTTGTQLVFGAGTIVNGNILNFNNTGSGVVFSNSTSWSIPRVNLLQGSITPGSNLTIGTATKAPTVQIGGIDEFTTTGSFTSLPTFNTTFGNATYLYAPTSTTLTTGSYNEMSVGAQTLSSITISDADGLISNRSITTTTLNLNGGNLSMGANNLTIGTSAANAGTLNRTTGMVSFNGGTFSRWYANGTQPLYGYASGFPIISGANERSVLLNSSANFTTGGKISILMNNINGFTNITPAFTDGSTNINRRSNSNWQIGVTGINIGTNTLSLRITGQGLGAISNVANLMMTKINSIEAGTASAGTGTNTIPFINRDFIQSQIPVSDTLFFGSDSAINPLSPMFTAITNGNWNNSSTWDAGAVPTSTNDVLIPSPYTVTLSSGTNSCQNV
ncbi:MAG: G8 domain-containing protein, partial [Bacteroidota bacterium]